MVVSVSDIPTLNSLYEAGKLQSVPSASTLPHADDINSRIGLFHGDITTLGVDAIVNAANKALRGGSGVDGAIHRAAGPALLAQCRTLGGCETGSAKITPGYLLPCKNVIHAVGPVYHPDEADEAEELLRGCYEASLELAVEAGCKSLAFSAISTGVYGYPSMDAAAVAIEAVFDFMGENKTTELKVVFVTFENKDQRAYADLLPIYFPATFDKPGTSEAVDASKETH